jgi:molybdopterin-containing oxidoreductase family iron-sulfur binding subunit
MSVSRRLFLAAGASAAAAVSGLRLIEFAGASPNEQSAEGASSARRWGMLIDPSRCASDCTTCITACKTENGLQGHDRPQTDVQWIRKVDLRDPDSGRTQTLPVMCQHCQNPPCVSVCPTGASFKRADGIVLVDRHVCIGCRYCMMACPYKARSFVHEEVTGQNPDVPRGKGTVEGCNLCVKRVDAGRLPACVESCPSGALLFGDLNDPASAIATRLREHGGAQIRADLRLNTSVRYQGLE